MPKKLVCPKCRQQIELDRQDASGRIICPSCGAKLRLGKRHRTDAPNLGDISSGLQPLSDLSDLSNLSDMDFPTSSYSLPTIPAPLPIASPKAAGASSHQTEQQTKIMLLVIFAGAAGLLVVTVGIGIGIWSFASSDSGDLRDSGASVTTAQAASTTTEVRGDFSSTGIKSQPVLLDTPVASAPRGGSSRGTPSFSAAEPFDGVEAARELENHRAATASSKDPGDLPQPLLKDEGTHWEAEVDAPIRGAEDPIAADLSIEFWPSRNDPILADLNGPFAIVPSVPEQQPYKATRRRVDNGAGGTDSVYSLTETPQAPVPVIDLRTGQRVGEFDWRVPFWSSPSLGPDGRYLIGPYHVPRTRLLGNLLEEATDALAALHVWQRDGNDPPLTLNVPGAVSWFGFVGNTEAAVLVETPKRQLQIWDVVTGTLRSSIELPMDWRKTSRKDDSRWPMQKQYRNPLGAVSPGGRYVAVGGGESIALISVAEARILGTLDVQLRSQEELDYRGMSFSAGGDRLIVAYQPEGGSNDSSRIAVIDARSGRRLRTWDRTGRAFGPLFVDEEGSSCIHGGMHWPVRSSAWLVDFTRQRDGFLLDIRQFVRWPTSGPALVIRAPDGERNRKLLAVDREALQMELAVIKGDPVPSIEFDPQPERVVQTSAPNAWHPLPDITPLAEGDYDVLPGPPWLTSYSSACIGVLHENQIEVSSGSGSKRYSVTASVRRVDRATGNPLGPSVVLREWTEETEGRVENRMVLFGMSPDAERFVTRDPRASDRVELWTSDGERLFSFAPLAGGEAVEWAEFADSDTLLVAGGGELTAWKLGTGSCQSIYRTSGGGYTVPFVLTPDRRILFASRGHSVDAVDVATGECLQRLGTKTNGMRVCDVAVSPGGRNLAALYVPFNTAEVLRRDRRTDRDDKSSFPVVIAVWDLKTGTAQQCQWNCRMFAFLTWVGDEHLCLGSTESHVFDMRAGEVALLYSDGFDQSGNVSIAKSCDGRIWRFLDQKMLTSEDNLESWEQLNSKENYPRRVLIWQATTLTGEKTAEELPFFADDAEYLSLIDTPIRLALDIADERQASSQGNKILAELQGRGFKVGPGGSLLGIRPRVTSSGSTLQVNGKAAGVPQVDYIWEIHDPQGRKVWSATTVGRFSFQQSKYGSGGGGPISTYDFGRVPMRQAVVEEILADGEGLKAVPDIPRQLSHSEGTFISFPQKLKWRIQPSNE